LERGLAVWYTGVGFQIMSYDKNIRISTVAESSLFSHTEMNAFNEAIEKELMDLQRLCKV
jgi:hypothetical protein